MDEKEALKKALKKAAKRRTDAMKARNEATEDLRRYCIAAKEAGIPISWIAAEAGLSRQGVYDLLAEPR